LAKITIPAVSKGTGLAVSVDARFQQIEDEFNNKVLYRDNPQGEDNSFKGDVDFGSKDILNVNNLEVLTGNGVVGSWEDFWTGSVASPEVLDIALDRAKNWELLIKVAVSGAYEVDLTLRIPSDEVPGTLKLSSLGFYDTPKVAYCYVYADVTSTGAISLYSSSIESSSTIVNIHTKEY
tara:strand:+ start:56 stop:592 length:537 start_codon:yes stop_codon:yes gene_type:complete